MIQTSPGLMSMGKSHVGVVAVLETILRGGVTREFAHAVGVEWDDLLHFGEQRRG